MVKIEKDLDDLVDALMKRIVPLMTLESSHLAAARRGMLTGPKEISEYLGWEYKRGISTRLVRWYLRYGFPINKSPQGVWWTTKSLIDKWMHNRELMMRTGRELGFYYPHGNYRDGKMKDVNPEKLNQKEKDAIVVEIKERRAQASMKHSTQC